MRKPFRMAKEVTVCDICGNRLVIPPGVYYRGWRMHKGEAMRMQRGDFDNEVKAPRLNDIEYQLQTLLTPPTGSVS
jgi:hypothetical protein